MDFGDMAICTNGERLRLFISEYSQIRRGNGSHVVLMFEAPE
jgi:hypothetical protein